MSVNPKLLLTPFRKDGPNIDPSYPQSHCNKNPRLSTAPASSLDSINFPGIEKRKEDTPLDIHVPEVPLPFSESRPLAMEQATHSLTLWRRNWALRSGCLHLVLYLFNLLLQTHLHLQLGPENVFQGPINHFPLYYTIKIISLIMKFKK